MGKDECALAAGFRSRKLGVRCTMSKSIPGTLINSPPSGSPPPSVCRGSDLVGVGPIRTRSDPRAMVSSTELSLKAIFWIDVEEKISL